MFTVVKRRCGIAPEITVHDDDIRLYIEDCKEDMLASGVPKQVVNRNNASVTTAITFYVKAHLGDDRTDTDKYMDLYQKKVFRLTLEE